MCGLCGALTKTSIVSSEIDNIRDLLILNHFRGEDSVGMFDLVKTKDDKNSTLYWKRKSHPIAFAKGEFEKTKVNRWTQKDNALLMLACHARAATQGKIIAENAHPFTFGNLLGMHNGTIAGDFKNRKKFDTDSEALIFNIHEMGLEEALKMVSKESTNLAYSLVLFDHIKKTISFVRNFQRPLHVLFKNSVLYWSSNAKDLNYVLDPTDMDKLAPVIDEKEKDYSKITSVKSLSPLRVYTVDLKSNETTWETEEITIPYSSSYSYFNRNNNYSSYEGSDYMSGYRHRDIFSADDYWNRKTLEDWSKMGNESKNFVEDQYDIAFGRYYTTFQSGKLDKWVENNIEAYYNVFKDRWDSLSKHKKKIEAKLTDRTPWAIEELLKEFEKAIKVSKKEKTEKSDNVIPMLPKYNKKEERKVDLNEDLIFPFGKLNRKCSTARFTQLLKKGCCWCGDPCGITEHLFWVDEEDFLCELCQDNILKEKNHMCNTIHNLDGLQEHVSSRYPISEYKE